MLINVELYFKIEVVDNKGNIKITRCVNHGWLAYNDPSNNGY